MARLPMTLALLMVLLTALVAGCAKRSEAPAGASGADKTGVAGATEPNAKAPPAEAKWGKGQPFMDSGELPDQVKQKKGVG